VRVWTGLILLTVGASGGNELLGSINGGEFLDYLNDNYLLYEGKKVNVKVKVKVSFCLTKHTA
jgi:hypothetical protein